MKNDALATRIRERLANEAREPNALAWTKIDEQLDLDRRKRKRRILFLWWWFGCFLLLMITLFLRVRYFEDSKRPSLPTASFYPSDGSFFPGHWLGKQEVPVKPFVSAPKVDAPDSSFKEGPPFLLKEEAEKKWTITSGNSMPLYENWSYWMDTLAAEFPATFLVAPLATRAPNGLVSTFEHVLEPPKFLKEPIPVIKPTSALAIWGTLAPNWNYFELSSNQQDNILLDKISFVPPFSVRRLGVMLQTGIALSVSSKTNFLFSTSYKYIPVQLQLATRQWIADSARITTNSVNSFVVTPFFQHKSLDVLGSLHQIGFSLNLEQQLVAAKHWSAGLQIGGNFSQTFGKHLTGQAVRQLQGIGGMYFKHQLSPALSIQVVPYASAPLWQKMNQEMAPFTAKNGQWGVQVGIIKKLRKNNN